MKIRHSTEQDLDRIMEIYRFARAFMAEHGNPNQWGPTNWPPEELIRSDIRNGCSYVCLNDADAVIGTFFFTQGKDMGRTSSRLTGISRTAPGWRTALTAWCTALPGTEAKRGSAPSVSTGHMNSAAIFGLIRTGITP